MGDIPAVPEDSEARHQRLAALDRAHLWHPFTQMQTWLEPLPGDEPVIIDHARGSWLFDTRGRKYLDAISSLWVNVHGHHRTELDSVKQYVRFGASPRGLQTLVLAGKVRALLEGRYNVAFDDLIAVSHPALRHRVFMRFEAEADDVTSDQLIDEIVETTDKSAA